MQTVTKAQGFRLRVRRVIAGRDALKRFAQALTDLIRFVYGTTVVLSVLPHMDPFAGAWRECTLRLQETAEGPCNPGVSGTAIPSESVLKVAGTGQLVSSMGITQSSRDGWVPEGSDTRGRLGTFQDSTSSACSVCRCPFGQVQDTLQGWSGADITKVTQRQAAGCAKPLQERSLPTRRSDRATTDAMVKQSDPRLDCAVQSYHGRRSGTCLGQRVTELTRCQCRSAPGRGVGGIRHAARDGEREGYRLWELDGRELIDIHLNAQRVVRRDESRADLLLAKGRA